MPVLSVQLYSIRDQVAADLPAALDRLAGIGVRHVEPFDVTGDPEGLRAALAAAGLSAPSAHAQLTDAAALGRVLDGAATAGVETVIHPFSPREQWTSEAGVHAAADAVAAALEPATARGLRIGYHNHDWELALLPDGRTALEAFADRAGPDVLLELDTYWAAVGGQDVPALLGRLGDRVRLLHVKDGPIDRDTAAQLPAGSGAMPFPAIMAAATAAELAVLEFDDYAGDVFDGIAAGHRYLTVLAG